MISCYTTLAGGLWDQVHRRRARTRWLCTARTCPQGLNGTLAAAVQEDGTDMTSLTKILGYVRSGRFPGLFQHDLKHVELRRLAAAALRRSDSEEEAAAAGGESAGQWLSAARKARNTESGDGTAGSIGAVGGVTEVSSEVPRTQRQTVSARWRHAARLARKQRHRLASARDATDPVWPARCSSAEDHGPPGSSSAALAATPEGAPGPASVPEDTAPVSGASAARDSGSVDNDGGSDGAPFPSVSEAPLRLPLGSYGKAAQKAAELSFAGLPDSVPSFIVGPDRHQPVPPGTLDRSSQFSFRTGTRGGPIASSEQVPDSPHDAFRTNQRVMADFAVTGGASMRRPAAGEGLVATGRAASTRQHSTQQAHERHEIEEVLGLEEGELARMSGSQLLTRVMKVKQAYGQALQDAPAAVDDAAADGDFKAPPNDGSRPLLPGKHTFPPVM
jgi:hypothetical protein